MHAKFLKAWIKACYFKIEAVRRTEVSSMNKGWQKAICERASLKKYFLSLTGGNQLQYKAHRNLWLI